MDKPAMTSATIWGGILVAIGQIVTPLGNWIGGTMSIEDAAAQILIGVGALVAIIGLRRKLGRLPQ